MKNLWYLLPLLFILISSCDKSDEKSYEYWSNQVSEKYKEIELLTGSVPCTNIDEFETVSIMRAAWLDYFLVHPSVKSRFLLRLQELNDLREKQLEAQLREGISIYYDAYFRYPLRKECKEGKATLVFTDDLTVDELNAEIPIRYEELKSFYKDVPCTNANEWASQRLRVNCCYEGFAVHKTIKTKEVMEKIQLYNEIVESKLMKEMTSCFNANCKGNIQPVKCVDNKAVVEML